MADTVMLDPAGRVRFEHVSIAHNAQLSSLVDLKGFMVKGIQMPASFTGTTITFQAAASAVPDTGSGEIDYEDVYDSAGNLLTVTVAAGRYVVLTQAQAAAVAGLRFIKLKSGSAEGAARAFSLVTAASYI